MHTYPCDPHKACGGRSSGRSEVDGEQDPHELDRIDPPCIGRALPFTLRFPAERSP